MSILFLRFFEVGVVAVAAALIFFLVKRRMWPEALVFCAAVATTACGEFINEFVTAVTVYPTAYLLRLPGTGIPLFILAGGAVLSVGIFGAAEWGPRRIGLQRRWYFVSSSVFLLSLPLPLLEVGGIELGLWRWLHPCDYSPGWFLGVWKFYFIFVAVPAMVVSFFPRYNSSRVLISV